MNSRLEKLLEFYREDPGDPFTIYAIATEYLSISKNEAKKYFEILLKEHEEYIATYYHAAQLYAELGMNEKAQEVFEKGIVLATQQNNQHALKELKSAYQNFLYES